MISHLSITGLILAGGLGRRMGGVDKGLQLLNGKPMVAHVLERLTPQVAEVLINANQNIALYSAYAHRVVSDVITGFAGPLAGLHAGMSQAEFDWVVSVPCDSPFLPADLVARLFLQLQENHADLAVAKTFDQVHPVFCLCHKKLGPHLESFLRTGGRKIDAWYASLKVTEVVFDDEPDAFRNINTLAELRGTD